MGAIPSMRGMELVLTRMNRISELDMENRLAVLEPGVVNLELRPFEPGLPVGRGPDPNWSFSE